MHAWPARYSTRAFTAHTAPWQVRLQVQRRSLVTSRVLRDGDPRVRHLGAQFSDEYATLRDTYSTPKHPIVLAHGLFGFSELKLTPVLPAVQYWHGIKDALTTQGATVIATSVPPSSSIASRAAKLANDIASQIPPSADGSDISVNIIAHSMGGLDARYMIANLLPAGVRVASLVTVATPHRGSSFADYVLAEGAGALYLPRLYGVIEMLGLGTSAFEQLTTKYMASEFNPSVLDDPLVRYFSYGAMVEKLPLLSPFRMSHRIVGQEEGPNDGLVSVESSRWGTYEGTLMGTSHLDLINWPNRVRWTLRGMMGMKRPFNAIAFYLDMADMLAKEGL